jgi:RND family efflux transporter MFP subunit
MNTNSFSVIPAKAGIQFLFVLLPFAAEAQQRPAPAVETAPVEIRQLAPRVTVTGQVQSRAAADLSAAVAGRLAWVAEPGARVIRNGLVARLDTEELELQKLEQQARLKRGEINLRQLTREAERLRASGNAVSRVQLDNAESARDLAAADLEIARAALRQTEQRLSRAEVRAPFGGVVSERLKRDGEEVNRGEIVARLLDPDTLEIRLFLPLRHVRAIKPGDKVKVLFDGREGAARVRAIVPAGDARSQSFEVLVDQLQSGPDSRLPAGSVVQVELPLGEPQALIAVPRDALIIRADGMTVYRVNAGENGESKVERIAVKSGVADGDWVAVDGKLAASDTVVVRGGESLQDGATVKVVGTRTWNAGSLSSPSRSAP